MSTSGKFVKIKTELDSRTGRARQKLRLKFLYRAPVAQWIEQISPKNKIQVRLLSGARARGIEVTHDDGIAESGVQFPAGPPAVVAQVVDAQL